MASGIMAKRSAVLMVNDSCDGFLRIVPLGDLTLNEEWGCCDWLQTGIAGGGWTSIYSH